MVRRGQVVALRYNGALFAPAALVTNVQERPDMLPMVGVVIVSDYGTPSIFGLLPPAVELEAAGSTGYGWDWADPVGVIAWPDDAAALEAAAGASAPETAAGEGGAGG